MADKDISPDKDGKLIKKIISEGVGEGQPKQGDEVFGEDITGDGGVIKNVIKEGKGFQKPSDGSTVNGI